MLGLVAGPKECEGRVLIELEISLPHHTWKDRSPPAPSGSGAKIKE
jgi:hypothetical protein